MFWLDGDELVSASLHGGRVKLTVHDGDDAWTTPPMPLGRPEDN